MQAFKVRYLDMQRMAVLEVVTHAITPTQAREQQEALSRKVLSVLAVADAVTNTSSQGSSSTERMKHQDVGWWCRELRTLLQAGMTVVEAMETLHVQSVGTDREEIQARLTQALAQGLSLSKAMKSSGAFSDVLVASVASGERTSSLVKSLGDYLKYDDMLQKLRRQAVSSAIYPAVVAGLGLVIALFLLLYVVPRFSMMYGNYRGHVSAATQVILSTSEFLRSHMPQVLMGLLLGAAVLVWLWRRGTLARVAGLVLNKVAPLQRQLNHYRYAKLYQSLSLMFRGGYPLDEAMEVCRGLALGGVIPQAVVHAQASMRQGRGVSDSFSEAGLSDQVDQRLLAVGERSGGFDVVLQTIADRHAQVFTTFVERATRIVEPLFLLLVALVVGGIVVMMYMPVFDIANSVR
jgi:general secretion pathway protein F